MTSDNAQDLLTTTFDYFMTGRNDASTEGTDLPDQIRAEVADDAGRTDYRELARTIFVYACPPIVFLGLVGNLLSFLVMISKSMRKQSTSVYMSVLAVADSLVLLHMFLTTWLTDVLGQPAYYRRDDVSCKLEQIHRRVCLLLAAWLVVSVSVERFLVTYFPLRAAIICSRRNAKIAVGGIVASVLIFSFTVVGRFGIKVGPCDLRDFLKYYDKMDTRWVFTTVYGFLPAAIILVINATTGILLSRRATESSAMTSSQHASKQTSKATKLVLTVAASYLLLTMPATISLPLMREARTNRALDRAWATYMVLIETGAFLLILTNHSINIILYVLVSDKVRGVLLGMLGLNRWLKKKEENVNDQQRYGSKGGAGSGKITKASEDGDHGTI